MLGLAGALAQGLFRNPLADPFLLGSASGASLGVAFALAALGSGGMLGLGSTMNSGVAVSVFSSSLWVRLGLTGAAFGGAVLAVLLTLLLASGVQHTLRLLLAGVVVGVVFGALASLLLIMYPQIQGSVQSFMLGSTAYVSWAACGLMLAVLVLSWLVSVAATLVLVGTLLLGRWQLQRAWMKERLAGQAISCQALPAIQGEGLTPTAFEGACDQQKELCKGQCVTEVMTKVVIYTDGACKGNPGPVGWGVLLRSGATEKELFGGELGTTNNRMELMAVIEALTALKRPCAVTLFLDSEYVRKGITEWIHGWKAKGWRTSSNQPVKNVELWKRLDALVSTGGHRIEWRWVKGHSGDPGNERADALANKGVDKANGR